MQIQCPSSKLDTCWCPRRPRRKTPPPQMAARDRALDTAVGIRRRALGRHLASAQWLGSAGGSHKVAPTWPRMATSDHSTHTERSIKKV